MPPMSEDTAKLIKQLLDTGWRVKQFNATTVTLEPDPDQENIYVS